MDWSQTIRLYPASRAVSINEVMLWLNRMLGARNVCNECSRLVLVLAVEFINVIGNINPNT